MPKIKDLPSRTVESVKGFTNDPINSLGFLIPMAMVLVSLISGFVGYVMFIVHGGYSQQVSYIKESGTNGISHGFTSGTTELLISGIIPKVIWLLFLAQLIIMLIAYFKAAGKVKRIIMIVDLIILVLIIVLSAVFVLMAVGTIVFSEQQIVMALEPYIGTTVNVKAILIAYAALMAGSIITFFVLTAISECRWMMGYSVLCLLFNYVAMPLVMLFLENIIPLIVGAIFLAAVIGIIFFIFKVVLSGDRSSTTVGSYDPSPAPSRAPINKKEEKKTEEPVEDKNHRYITDYKRFGGIDLYKHHGSLNDYIQLDNHIATRDLCTLDEMRKGIVHIYDRNTGREISFDEIPWRNQD